MTNSIVTYSIPVFACPEEVRDSIERMGLGVIRSIERTTDNERSANMLTITVVHMESWSEKGETFRDSLRPPNGDYHSGVLVWPHCSPCYYWNFYNYKSEE